MEIVKYSPGESYESDVPCAVAIGCFDGVHRGHRALLRLLVERSRSLGIKPCVLTFTGIMPKNANMNTIIYNFEDKVDLFSYFGIERVVIADFSDISNMSPESFVRDVLVRDLKTELAAVGYNFRFGKGAKGSSEMLVSLMKAHGKSAEILGEQSTEDGSISSTKIRSLLLGGRIKKANKLLGSPYFIHGTVEKGLGLGKVYGFPTVNISLGKSSPLATGVYRTAVKIHEKLYTGVTNIGACPTVKEREIHAETMIAEFDGDLYGEDIYIFFLDYLREEKRFESIEALKQQIYADRDRAVKENGDLKWLEIGQS